MSSILYVFYNAEVIERCIDSVLDMIAAGFIDDIAILVTEDSAENNLRKLNIAHERIDR